MACPSAANISSTISKSSPHASSTTSLFPCKTLTHVSVLGRLHSPISAVISSDCRPTAAPLSVRKPTTRPSPEECLKGADVLVEALEREGVTDVFAYPGGASLEIHQALTRSRTITNHLLRHEQGEVFAAEGYARSTGRPGVCIATSGPGATNIVTGLADALLDSVPLVAITGQVPRSMIGTDAFQELPIVEITRSITKHNYLVLNVEDIPRVIAEAFFLATSGRPGPVLVDIPKDIQQQLVVPSWNRRLHLQGYVSRLPKPPQRHILEQVLRHISNSRRPLLYVGGGCINAAKELRRFAELTGIPVTTTLMGLGVYPSADSRSLKMLGMHGTVYANYAVDKCDLLLAFGVRFDDRVTGKVEAFAARATIVHIDIDSSEIGKNKEAHVSICGDVKPALEEMNAMIKSTGLNYRRDFSPWIRELDQVKNAHPLSYKHLSEDRIPPQYAIEVLDEMTKGEAIVCTGVGQHQMWAAQYYGFKRPRQWLSSGGLGAMGFGLPAAVGASVANPGALVVDIDGDGSFLMNVQELALVRVERLPVKIMLLNNQHLGMVVQLEDTFYRANHADTYLGNPENEDGIYPDLVAIAQGFDIPAARVRRVSEVREAVRKMVETPGPYLLDIIVPHQEHVLPMIPNGKTFQDIIVEGDGKGKSFYLENPQFQMN